MHDLPVHFGGKDAVGHVAEAQARGLAAKTESHAHETPGHLSAFADSLRETALLLALFWGILSQLTLKSPYIELATALLCSSWLIWKIGRSAWLGWSRLERLHRVVKEEKWEIDHHRKQEREELKALYAVKGFEGQLLEDVLDVLMADGDRLLRVMVEEELGLTLEQTEHPLKQAWGAALGSISALMLGFIGIFFFGYVGIIFATFLCASLAAAMAAYYEQNKLIPAIIWNLGLVALPLATAHFIGQFFFGT